MEVLLPIVSKIKPILVKSKDAALEKSCKVTAFFWYKQEIGVK